MKVFGSSAFGDREAAPVTCPTSRKSSLSHAERISSYSSIFRLTIYGNYNLVQQWRLTLDRNICMYASRRYKKRIPQYNPPLYEPIVCSTLVHAAALYGSVSGELVPPFLFDAIAAFATRSSCSFCFASSRLRSAFSSLAFRRADCSCRAPAWLGSSLKRSWRVNMTSSNCPAFNWACPFPAIPLYSCLLLLLLLVLPFRSF